VVLWFVIIGELVLVRNGTYFILIVVKGRVWWRSAFWYFVCW